MAGIPRFEAQIGRISVPTMQNFQQEQNEHIYRAVAGVAEKTANVAEQMYAAQKMDEAVKEGGRATKDTDLSQLPVALTRQQEAYNNAAVASFYTDFSVEAERVINESAFNNQDNPAQFLVETDSYINGVSENIPDHLKKQILRPVQMAREAKYDTLLKHQISRNQKSSLENLQFNMWKKRQSANLIDSDAALNNYLADAETTAEMFVSSGGTAEQAIKYLDSAYEDGLNRYLSRYYMKEVLEPRQFEKFFKDVQLGRTGIRQLDMMPPERRINIANKAFDDLNKSENALAEKNFTIASNTEARMNIVTLNNVTEKLGGVEINELNEAYTSGYTNQNIIDAIDNIQNGVAKSTPAGNGNDVIYAAKYGRVSLDDLIAMRNLGSLGDEDFLLAAKALNSYQMTNRQLKSFQDSRKRIVDSYPNVLDDSGNILKTNEKQAFLLNKLDEFADSRELDNQMVEAYTNEIIKAADASFNDKNSYRPMFTRDKFYNMFGAKYNEVSEIAKKYIHGESFNRARFKKEIVQKYNITSSRADAMLTYWDKIRRLEAENVK